jgi:hypothetical protein
MLCLPLLLLLNGCATVSMMPAEDDKRAKTFEVAGSKANIYLYRHETFGAAIKMPVSLNGRMAGDTASKTYFLWEVDPGTYDISSHTENTATLKLTVEAGKNYFVWQEVKMGLLMARSELKQVDEATGRREVAECSRAVSTY